MKKSTKVLGAVAAIGASTTLVGGAVHADSVSTDKPQTSQVQELRAVSQVAAVQVDGMTIPLE